CESNHALSPGPLGVTHTRISEDGVGQVGFPLLADQADLVLAHGHPAVSTIEMRVQARTGLQFQHIIRFVQRPDACERPIQVPDHRLGTLAKHVWQVVALAHRQSDILTELRQTQLLLKPFLYLRDARRTEIDGRHEWSLSLWSRKSAYPFVPCRPLPVTRRRHGRLRAVHPGAGRISSALHGEPTKWHSME